MRRIIGILIFPMVFIFSCKTEKEETPVNLHNENEEQSIAHASVDTLHISDTLTNTGKITMQEILEAFRYCKETAENNLQCKYFIAKAVDDYFGVKDFKLAGQYIDFEHILFTVRSHSKWKSIGMANQQTSLDEAQKMANEGKPVLAIQTTTKFGHVVIVMPGKLEKAISWGGLNCPQVASFFMIQDLESFVDKSIAFAWGSPDGIELFVRQ